MYIIEFLNPAWSKPRIVSGAGFKFLKPKTKAMKTYIANGTKFQENKCDIRNLRNLEISVKEVKTRKKCFCSICHRIIKSGEKALKTAQRHNKTESYYQTFCDECYQSIN